MTRLQRSGPGQVVSAVLGRVTVRASHVGKLLLVLAVGAGGLWTATHGVAGVAWSDVANVMKAVTPVQFLMLTVVWLIGLGIWSTVLSAALPGLSLRRGLLLNLSGSAVANVMPLGGAVATGLNWKMARTWGHSNLSFVTFTVLINLLHIVSKLILPLVAVAALFAVTGHVPTALWAMTVVCVAGLVICTGIHLAMRSRVSESVKALRDLVSREWLRLLPASAGYVAAQVALLYVSLQVVGVHASVTVVLMAAAIERLGTLIPITPGGTGVAEIGTIAWLVASGLDPVEVVAGVLLYRIFLVALEIPVGGTLLAGWALLRRWAPPAPVNT